VHLHYQPKQQRLLDLMLSTGPDAATIIGAGGAKGGGKSGAAQNIAVSLAVELGGKYPGFPVTIVRRVFKDLQDNHVSAMKMRWPELQAYWSAGQEHFAFRGAGVIQFRYSETTEDTRRKFLGGFQTGILIIDEAQQFSEEELKWMILSARWPGVAPNTCKVLMLFNPGGISGSYLRRVFWWKNYEGEELAGNYEFLHIFGWDNYEWFRGQCNIKQKDFYALPSQCRDGMDPADRGDGQCCRYHLFIRDTSEGRKYNEMPPSIRMGMLLGNFDHFEGQYYAGVWDEELSTISAVECGQIVQYWWTRWMSLDWGFSHYSVNVWLAAGKVPARITKQVFGYERDIDAIVIERAIAERRAAEYDFGRRIAEITPKQEIREIRRWFVDGTILHKDADHPVSELIMSATTPHGFPKMEPAVKDRVSGWRTLHDCLRRTLVFRRTGELSKGPLLLVSRECAGVIAALPVLQTDPKKPEDVLKLDTVHDDIADAVRYGVESWIRSKDTAPFEVRAREVYNSVEDPTWRHIRMKEFEMENADKGRTVRW